MVVLGTGAEVGVGVGADFDVYAVGGEVVCFVGLYAAGDDG